MRAPISLVLVVVAGLVATDAAAQPRGGARMQGNSMQQSARPPAPPSNLLPPLSNGPNPITRPAGPNDIFRATQRTYAPRYGRLSALFGGAYGGYYGGYYDAGGYLPFMPAVPDEPVAEGRLNLYVTPSSAQVLVDGFYMGTVADYQDRSLWLEPGPRRIELRAEGYEPAAFDVQIIEDRIVDYRRDLSRDAAVAAPAQAPRPPATPKTFYVIPGCYAGDTPPAVNRLPSGCSTSNLKTVPPLVSRHTPRGGA